MWLCGLMNTLAVALGAAEEQEETVEVTVTAGAVVVAVTVVGSAVTVS